MIPFFQKLTFIAPWHLELGMQLKKKPGVSKTDTFTGNSTGMQGRGVIAVHLLLDIY